MGIQILSIISLLAIISLATGQSCFKCVGGTADHDDAKVTAALKAFINNPKCVNDIDSLKDYTNCTGGSMYCSKNVETLTGKVGDIDVVLTVVTRDCKAATPVPTIECKETNTGKITLANFKPVTEACVCKGDKCNGQTTIAPTVVTCLLSLVLAVCAMF